MLAQTLLDAYGDGLNFWVLSFGPDAPKFEDSPIEWVSKHLCEPLARAYLAQLDDLSSDDDGLVARLVEELIGFIEADGQPHKLRFCVGGVSVPEGTVSSRNFEVHQLTNDELGQMVKMPAMFDTGPGRLVLGQPWVSLNWPTALVTFSFNGAKLNQEGGVAATSKLQRLLTALSILGVELWAPHAQADIRIDPHWLNGSVLGTAPLGAKVLDWNSTKKTDVTQELLDRATRIADKIPANAWSQPKSYKDVVYHRYMQGCARRQDIDRVFDFVVAMESCLVHDSVELGHKFGLFGAQFLGTDGHERLELRDRFRTLYSLRSRLAHGTKFPTQEEISAGAKSSQELCQRMLLKCLEDGWPVDGDLDNQLLSREGE